MNKRSEWELAVAHPQNGYLSTVSRSNCNLQCRSVGFLGKRKLENPENRDKKQQQTQPRYNIGPGIRWKESVLTSALSLLPIKRKVPFEMTYSSSFKTPHTVKVVQYSYFCSQGHAESH